MEWMIKYRIAGSNEIRTEVVNVLPSQSGNIQDWWEKQSYKKGIKMGSSAYKKYEFSRRDKEFICAIPISPHGKYCTF